MTFFTTAFRRAVTTSAVAATVTFGSLSTAIAQNVSLTGAGATFPQPLYERYFADPDFKSKTNLNVSYQGIGSGGGIRLMTAGVVDFGASDAAMTDAEESKVKQGVVFVPAAGGAIAVVYNAPGVTDLKLSRKVLPAIFDGQITQWNDPQIAADNPGVTLPSIPIKLVVRADSSGTTFNFTNHLSAVDPYFKGRIGTDKAPRWAASPLKGTGNPGVAQLVKRTVGTIGYVETAYVKSGKLTAALVQNKAGNFVPPTLEEANRALANVKLKDDFRVSFKDLGDPADGYPITALTWLMVYKTYTTPGKAAAVKKMVQWVLTDGQKLNKTLDYTEAPANYTTAVLNAVNTEVTGP